MYAIDGRRKLDMQELLALLDKDFIRLRDFMYSNFGINLSSKRGLIEGRLNSVVQRKGYKSFTEYIDNLMRDQSGEELSILISKLTTNFTYFMREQKHYDFLVKKALPELTPKIPDRDLRIWSAGCSSGEEPYTIAMTLNNYFKENKSAWDTVVLASDISDNVLNAAKNGIYSLDRINQLSDEWRKKFFVKLDENTYQVSKELRNEVFFKKFNLMEKTFVFKKKFHVIFCRNVMIYFDNQTRRELTNKFLDVLMPGGYLFIGLSETLLNLKTRFEYVEPAIYRKPIE